MLIRGYPLRLTGAGQKLLEHTRKIQRYEQELDLSLRADTANDYSIVTLGVNSDSLATWFFEAVSPVIEKEKLLLDLIIENEDLTFAMLKRGEVLGCISSSSKKLSGCEAEKLGTMHYYCAATPDFAAKYFPDGLNADVVREVPAVIFNSLDFMHIDFLKQQFGVKELDFPYHKIASSEGFLESVRSGISYGMIPGLQAQQDFKSRKLMNLLPGKHWKQVLFWHRQRRPERQFKKLSEEIVKNARKLIKPAVKII